MPEAAGPVGRRVTEMRVTHVLDTGARAVELEAGVFVIEGASATTRAALGAHGVVVTATPDAGSIEVSDLTLAYADRVMNGRRRIDRRKADHGATGASWVP